MIIIQWLLFYCNTKNKINGIDILNILILLELSISMYTNTFLNLGQNIQIKKKIKISCLKIVGPGTFHNYIIYYKFLNL